MRKTKAEALKTREYLMLAALDTFYRQGVARASLNEIAQTAGVTRGALYWHFKNKEDLFDALFQHIFKDFRESLSADIENASPDTWENLRCALVNLYERIQHNETYRKFMTILHLKCEHTEKNEAIVNLMTQYNLMWHDQLSAALALCVRQQKLPADLNIDLAVIYLKSACNGLAQLWLSNPQRFDLEKTAPMVVETAMSTLQKCPTLRTSGEAQ
ncbi:TetR family transcriptional regulator [Uruburuella testudinis]|uniref:TetR family transcriptional regulator n=1 Tax=Uruburuella testudinis TaxID=1282863 RepID=A0ABY4DUB5_9NEIS|nr:TetR family transcriptional regulator [Uruburuella testudinis]UOO82304.1 TetR family transcriptional regulator [Uruburuella testudinis]